MQEMLKAFLTEDESIAASKAIFKFNKFLSSCYIDHDDVVQILFIKVQNIKKTGNNTITPALIYTVVKNLIINEINRKSNQTLSSEFFEEESSDSFCFADAKIDFDSLTEEDKMVLKLKCGVMTHRQLLKAGISRSKIDMRSRSLKNKGFYV